MLGFLRMSHTSSNVTMYGACVAGLSVYLAAHIFIGICELQFWIWDFPVDVYQERQCFDADPTDSFEE